MGDSAVTVPPGAMGDQTSKVPTARQIEQLVRAAIAQGDVGPGERLPLPVLARHWRIPTATVREGLARLLRAGLLIADDQG